MSSEGRNTLRNSDEKIPPFFIILVFLILRADERFGCFSRNSLGGMFSGRLDQSQIQSAFLFIRFSTSRLLSRKSSSDCELFLPPELFMSEPLRRCKGVCDLGGLSQGTLPLELLLPDSCWASKSIFSMSPLAAIGPGS